MPCVGSLALLSACPWVRQHGKEVPTKHEKFQNRFFAVVDGPQPHIAWFKDQKDYKAKKAPQGTLALRQGNASIQKGVDSSLLPVRVCAAASKLLLLQQVLERVSGSVRPIAGQATCLTVALASALRSQMSFIVSTPERNLRLKTLEGQDANDWVKLINIIGECVEQFGRTACPVSLRAPVTDLDATLSICSGRNAKANRGR